MSGKPPRILFAASHCYLDDSNGAAVASRSMLEALGRHGIATEALSGTKLEIRDGVDLEAWLASRGAHFHPPGGACTIDARGMRFEVPPHYTVDSRGVPVTLYRTSLGISNPPDETERDEFLRLFEVVAERFRPDVIVNYGGDDLARDVRSHARKRGCLVVFALHNFNYRDIHLFRTVDAVIVASRFAAEYYHGNLGLGCVVLPNLVNFNRAIPDEYDRRYVTFVNPCREKGVFAFARIADELGRRRPDIPLLVVESRGSESTLVGCGIDLRVRGNVFLMENTNDPRLFWGVTKVCLMPSLWWENQPLAAVEAMINGIPVVGSDRGGIPETLGDAGVMLPLPEWLTPFTRTLPTAEEVAPWVEAVIRLWNDAGWYSEQSRLALAESERWSPDILEPLYVEFFQSLRAGGRLL